MYPVRTPRSARKQSQTHSSNANHPRTALSTVAAPATPVELTGNGPLSFAEAAHHRQSLRFLDVHQCRAIGNFSESTWRRLVAGGVMPQPVKFGRVARWAEADVLAAYERAKGGKHE